MIPHKPTSREMIEAIHALGNPSSEQKARVRSSVFQAAGIAASASVVVPNVASHALAKGITLSKFSALVATTGLVAAAFVAGRMSVTSIQPTANSTRDSATTMQPVVVAPSTRTPLPAFETPSTVPSLQPAHEARVHAIAVAPRHRRQPSVELPLQDELFDEPDAARVGEVALFREIVVAYRSNATTTLSTLLNEYENSYRDGRFAEQVARVRARSGQL